MGRRTHVREHIRDGHVVRAHTRGVPEKAGASAVVVLAAVIFIAVIYGNEPTTSSSSNPGASGVSGSSSLWEPVEIPDAWVPATLPGERSVSRSDRAEWAEAWLRGYRTGPSNCQSSARLWVVQPGSSGMYRLTSGCFPQGWKNTIVKKCQSYRGLPAGKCAVWDPASVMTSTAGTQGDLQIVVLTDACLTRAGLDDFHVGPLHHDCVIAAE